MLLPGDRVVGCNVYLLGFLFLYTCLSEMHLVTCVYTCRSFFVVRILVIVAKYMYHKIYQFSHFTVYSLGAFLAPTVLCHHPLSLAPEQFSSPKKTPRPH